MPLYVSRHSNLVVGAVHFVEDGAKAEDEVAAVAAVRAHFTEDPGAHVSYGASYDPLLAAYVDDHNDFVAVPTAEETAEAAKPKTKAAEKKEAAAEKADEKAAKADEKAAVAADEKPGKADVYVVPKPDAAPERAPERVPERGPAPGLVPERVPEPTPAPKPRTTTGVVSTKPDADDGAATPSK